MEKTVGPPEVKAEVFEAEVKQEPDRRVKMEEVEDEEFITHPPLDQPDWMQTRTGNQLADDMEDELQGFGYAAPDFNDSDDENLLDLDAATPRLKKSASAGPSLGSMAPPPMKEEPDDTPWSSVGQLVAFREQSVAIGNDYLKTQGIKLKAGGKRKALEFKDREAQRLYKLGQEDAEKIDVRQKRLIKDVEMDE
ncbi:hypothetical protein C8J57DRAFT_587495 [Mycena rebaudengoi]|nr:hypothetical protein C8J57DRAFT_587495 [Mycena rebaudengoi]